MINTVHWSEPAEAKAQIMRDAAERCAEQGRASTTVDHSAISLDDAFREADDATLARLCDILKGN